MSVLLVPTVFAAILGLYCLVEDIWAIFKASRPMARQLSRRQLERKYEQRYRLGREYGLIK